VASIELAHELDLSQLQTDLGDKCRAGSVESCVAALDLKAYSALPRWSETPARELRALRERTQDLLALCKRRSTAACHRLGELAHLAERGASVPELSAHAGLMSTLEQALRSDPRQIGRATLLASALVTGLRNGQSPGRDSVKSWSAACIQGSPGACLLGATVGWDDPDGYDDTFQAEVAKPPTQLAELPVARALVDYCNSRRVACAEARSHELSAGLSTPDNYCSSIRQLCAAEDATACFQLATALGNSACPALAVDEAPFFAYQRACAFGSARSCGLLIQPALDAGTPTAALSYALSACQRQNPDGCRDLVYQFAESRRYTDEKTGSELTAYACDMGYLYACHNQYVAEYLAGGVQSARQNLFRLCVNQEHVRSCRTAAQIDWVGGHPDVAQSILERQCLGPSDDRDSCIEFGSLLAHRGERARALNVLTRECQRLDTGRSLSSPRKVCSLARRIEAGYSPQALGEIFLEPIQGSRDVLD
jgi:hypothetical protein